MLDDVAAQRPLLAIAFYVLAYATGGIAFALLARLSGIATDGIAILALAGLSGGALGAQLFQLLGGEVPGKSLPGVGAMKRFGPAWEG